MTANAHAMAGCYGPSSDTSWSANLQTNEPAIGLLGTQRNESYANNPTQNAA